MHANRTISTKNDYTVSNVRIETVGHALATGTEVGNIRLSRARAKKVRSLLISKGISPTQLIALGIGSSEQLGLESAPQYDEKISGVTFRILVTKIADE